MAAEFGHSVVDLNLEVSESSSFQTSIAMAEDRFTRSDALDGKPLPLLIRASLKLLNLLEVPKLVAMVRT